MLESRANDSLNMEGSGIVSLWVLRPGKPSLEGIFCVRDSSRQPGPISAGLSHGCPQSGKVSWGFGGYLVCSPLRVFYPRVIEFRYLLEESEPDGAKSTILENSGFLFITNLVDLIED